MFDFCIIQLKKEDVDSIALYASSFSVSDSFY